MNRYWHSANPIFVEQKSKRWDNLKAYRACVNLHIWKSQRAKVLICGTSSLSFYFFDFQQTSFIQLLLLLLKKSCIEKFAPGRNCFITNPGSTENETQQRCHFVSNDQGAQRRCPLPLPNKMALYWLGGIRQEDSLILYPPENLIKKMHRKYWCWYI